MCGATGLSNFTNPSAYSFGNISNEEIGCGQLVQNKISSEK